MLMMFWEIHLKLLYFSYIAKEDWKEDCNSYNVLQFSLVARG